MSLPVRLHDEARHELVDAGRWTVREWQALATEFDETVESVLTTVGERPEYYTPAPDAPPGVDARQVFVGRFPYRFVFVEGTALSSCSLLLTSDSDRATGSNGSADSCRQGLQRAQVEPSRQRQAELAAIPLQPRFNTSLSIPDDGRD